MAEIELAPLPAEEAIAFFRAKGARIEQQFDWRDWDARAHATAFTVAKSTVADVAGDIHAELLKTLEGGGTFEQFKRDLVPTLKAKGWWGKAVVTDPKTGESQRVQLGSNRRLRVIFDTNLRMAYSHGRWQRIERRAEGAPWLRYVAVQDSRTRPEHLAWHGTVLPVGHPWWETHYPPCGWNCRCIVQQLSDRDLARRGLTPSEAPPPGETKAWRNARTGEVLSIPEGIDPGFAHNVGKIGLEEHAAQFYMDKLGGLPPALAAAASRASAPVVLEALQRGFKAWAELVGVRGYRPSGQRRVIGVVTPAIEAALVSRGVEVRSAALAVRDQALAHALRPVKQQTGAALRPADLARLPTVLARPKAVLLDLDSGELLYVAEVPGNARLAKYVFRPAYSTKGQDSDRRRRRLTLTDFITAGLVDPVTLRDPSRYRLLEGSW